MLGRRLADNPGNHARVVGGLGVAHRYYGEAGRLLPNRVGSPAIDDVVMQGQPEGDTSTRGISGGGKTLEVEIPFLRAVAEVLNCAGAIQHRKGIRGAIETVPVINRR